MSLTREFLDHFRAKRAARLMKQRRREKNKRVFKKLKGTWKSKERKNRQVKWNRRHFDRGAYTQGGLLFDPIEGAPGAFEISVNI